MDRNAKNRVAGLVRGIRHVLDEARRAGSPVEPIAGGRDLLVALEAHLAGKDLLLRRLLGFVNERPGAPGRDSAAKVRLVRQFRELRLQGVTREVAASRVGVDQRTIDRWSQQSAGFAEEIDARLTGLGAPTRSQKRKGET
jgi:hypothetical protein